MPLAQSEHGIERRRVAPLIPAPKTAVWPQKQHTHTRDVFIVEQHIFDVTTPSFQRDVMEKSLTVPVVVDFWAARCSPCQVLGPILEKVVGEYGGKVVLAKVDVESCPELAEQYGVKGIPAVKVFVNGKVAAEFTGAMPEPQVREFLRQAVPSRADELVRQAQEMRENGRLEDAESLARRALQGAPENQGALEIAAATALAAGRVDESLDFVNRMESVPKDIQFLMDGAEFWRMCAEAADDEKTIARLPQDPEAKMSLAACLASKGEFPQALNLLLEVIETDKSFRDGLARKAIVSIFVVMGLTNPVVREYQSRLAQLLF